MSFQIVLDNFFGGMILVLIMYRLHPTTLIQDRAVGLWSMEELPISVKDFVD